MRRLWRRKAFRVLVYLSATLFVLYAVIVSVAADKQTNSVATCQPDASQLLTYVNAERSRTGAPVLMIDSSLATSARNKLNDEITNQYYGHNLIDGSNDVSIIRTQGVNAASSEDLDANAFTALIDWTKFKNSPAHYASLTNPQYTRVGIAVQCTNYRVVKQTDPNGDAPVESEIKELTVIHLASQ